MVTLKRVIISLLLIPLALSCYFMFSFYLFVSTPASSKIKNTNIHIPKGTSLENISQLLHRNGLIKDVKYFKALTYLKGVHQNLKAGDYQLQSNLTPPEVIESLLNPKTAETVITIPEGFNIRQIASLLHRKNLISSPEVFIQSAKPSLLPQHYPILNKTLEGYLFPETYRIPVGASISQIMNLMVSEFFNRIKVFAQEIEKSQFSLNEITTIASIIEKETGVGERKLISSVIYNRLRKKMRLQMDPTVIYGIENFNGNLTKKDLQTYTPFNTYKIKGIPPGPIANPGIKSFEAALRPAKSDVLYFVARNDGTHIFSKTFAEHKKYVKKYQMSRKYRNRMRKQKSRN